MALYWHIDEVPEGTVVVDMLDRRFLFHRGRFDDGMHQQHASELDWPLFADNGDHP